MKTSQIVTLFALVAAAMAFAPNAPKGESTPAAMFVRRTLWHTLHDEEHGQERNLSELSSISITRCWSSPYNGSISTPQLTCDLNELHILLTLLKKRIGPSLQQYSIGPLNKLHILLTPLKKRIGPSPRSSFSFTSTQRLSSTSRDIQMARNNETAHPLLILSFQHNLFIRQPNSNGTRKSTGLFKSWACLEEIKKCPWWQSKLVDLY